MATNVGIACSGADAVNDDGLAPKEPVVSSAPLDASASTLDGIDVEQTSNELPDAGADAGSDAQPLSPQTCQPACLPVTWLADVLRSAGLQVWEDPDWRTNGHGSFHDLWGVMAHHTGVDRDTEWKVVRDGTSSLSGPLSQLVLEKNGLFRVVASGVAWHAGAGSYPGMADNDANFHTIGIEAVNTGTSGWTTAQYSAYVRGVAAILRYLSLDANRVIGHKEWAGAAQGKWDPGLIDMDVFRADVQAILDQ